LEQGYFVFWFVIVFIVWYIGMKSKDNLIQIKLNLFTSIFFLIFALMTFGTFNLVFDSGTSEFVKYNEANISLQTMAPFGICMFLFLDSTFKFIMSFYLFWRYTVKGLKMPEKMV